MTFRKVPAQREFSMGPPLCRVLLVHSRSVEIPVKGPWAVLAQRLHTETVCVQALHRSGKEVWATRVNRNEDPKHSLTDTSHYSAQTPGVILIPGPDISDQEKAPALTGCGTISNPSHPITAPMLPKTEKAKRILMNLLHIWLGPTRGETSPTGECCSSLVPHHVGPPASPAQGSPLTSMTSLLPPVTETKASVKVEHSWATDLTPVPTQAHRHCRPPSEGRIR